MSQFDEVMAKLDRIELLWNDVGHKLDLIATRLGILKHMDLLSGEVEGNLFGDDPVDHEDYGTADESGMEIELATEIYPPQEEVLKPPLPGVTRRFVEVRGTDGKMKKVKIEDIDPYIMRVIEASNKAGAFWMLYERDTDHQIMVSAEEQVINQVARGEVPETQNAPDRDTGL